MAASFHHIPVMAKEVLRLLASPSPLRRLLIDCTVGGGGHAAMLLLADSQSSLIGFDRDPAAVEAAEKKIASMVPGGNERACIIHDSYTAIAKHAAPGTVDGIFVDLGISSYQLDDAKRGFSFFDDEGASLSMRFDDGKGVMASDLVNGLSEGELANVFRVYGEEPHAVFVARKIVEARQGGAIKTARQLSSIIADAVSEANSAASRKHGGKRRGADGSGGGGSHPATRCFQALRIAVNGELDAAEKLLKTAPSLLKVGGRFAAITFHSLEDRLVKNAFKTLVERSKRGKQEQSSTVKASEKVPFRDYRFAFAAGKAFWRPSEEEVAANPRSRSATLRCIERIA